MPLHVLVLESQPRHADALVAYLSSERPDLEAEHVNDPDGFARALRRGMCDVALSLDGDAADERLALLETARRLAPRVPLVFVGQRVGEEAMVEVIRGGASDFVCFDKLDGLGAAVRRALRDRDERSRAWDLERERDEALREAREAHRLAENATKLREEFLAVVSHELRAPLNAVLGWVRLLRSGLPEARRGFALDAIERNAAAQAKLVDTLLDLAELSSGRLVLSTREVDLADVVAGAVEALRPAAALKGLEMRTRFEPLPRLTGDPDRLRQVAWNLVSNAVKFTPGGGQVEVQLAHREDRIAFSVADSGEGIAPEHLPHVFDPFHAPLRDPFADRAVESPGTRRPHGGLGAGLSLVKRLVELHGGVVRVDSPGLHAGATVTIHLPVLSAPPPAANAPVREP